jgi:hypothetical protein
MFGKKKKEQVCGTCRLYNNEKGTCRVAVLYAGEQIHIPVDPVDKCFYENQYLPADKPGKTGEKVLDHIKQVRFWVENPNTGEQAKEGVVKVELPKEDFN